jgi:hypothetical protein
MHPLTNNHLGSNRPSLAATTTCTREHSKLRKSPLTRAGQAVLLFLLFVTGCLNNREVLKTDYLEFDRNYGEASDQQMLLNLARLANNGPVYFMQLSSISSEYQRTSSAGISPGTAETIPGKYRSGLTKTTGSFPPTGGDTTTTSWGEFAQDAFNVSGTLNRSLTVTPIFQFVPLTGSNMVNAVETPISEKVFDYFYDQGYPANLVARTMVAAVLHIASITTNFTTNFTVELQTNYPHEFPFQFLTNLTLNQVSNLPQHFDHSFVIDTNNKLVATLTAELPLTHATSYGADGSTNSELNLNLPTAVTTNILLAGTDAAAPRVVARVVPHFVTNYEYFMNSPSDATYPKFLGFCQDLVDAQKSHFLTVEEKVTNNTPIFSSLNYKLSEVVGAAVSNLNVKLDTNTGRLTVSKSQSGPSFALNDATPEDPRFRTMEQFLKEIDQPKNLVSVELRRFWGVPENQPFEDFLLANGPSFGYNLLSNLNLAITKHEPWGWAVSNLAALDARQFQLASNFIKASFSSADDRDRRFLEQLYPPLADKTLFRIYEPTSLFTDEDASTQDRGAIRSYERMLTVKRTAAGLKTNGYTLKMMTVEAAMYKAAQEERYYRRYSRPDFTIDSIGSFESLIYELTNPDFWATGAISNELNKLQFKLTTEETKILQSPVETQVVREHRLKLVNCLNTVLSHHIFRECDVPNFPTAAQELWSVSEHFPEADLKRFNHYLLTLSYPSLRARSVQCAPYTNAYFWCDVNGPYGVCSHKDVDGTGHDIFQVQPLMRLTIDTNSNPGEQPPAVIATSIQFNSPPAGMKRYFVGDAAETTVQDRQVFTMLTYLYNQTAVSTTNLPVQQLIHLQ